MDFHPNVNARLRENSFSKHRTSGLITEDDEALIREYVAEYHARRQVKEHRIQKTIVDLIQWRRFLLVPF